MEIGQEIKQSKFATPQLKAIINILFTNSWLQSKIKRMLKPYGITHQQYNVLRILNGRFPDACCASDIKNVMVDKTPDLTRLIDRLIKKDLVHRSVCPSNRRKVDITITKTGREVLALIKPTVVKNWDNLENITDEEAEILSNILDKLRQS